MRHVRTCGGLPSKRRREPWWYPSVNDLVDATHDVVEMQHLRGKRT